MYAPLAQLDRAFGYGPKGRGFEFFTARQYLSMFRQVFFVQKFILQMNMVFSIMKS